MLDTHTTLRIWNQILKRKMEIKNWEPTYKNKKPPKECFRFLLLLWFNRGGGCCQRGQGAPPTGQQGTHPRVPSGSRVGSPDSLLAFGTGWPNITCHRILLSQYGVFLSVCDESQMHSCCPCFSRTVIHNNILCENLKKKCDPWTTSTFPSDVIISAY